MTAPGGVRVVTRWARGGPATRGRCCTPRAQRRGARCLRRGSWRCGGLEGPHGESPCSSVARGGVGVLGRPADAAHCMLTAEAHTVGMIRSCLWWTPPMDLCPSMGLCPPVPVLPTAGTSRTAGGLGHTAPTLGGPHATRVCVTMSAGSLPLMRAWTMAAGGARHMQTPWPWAGGAGAWSVTASSARPGAPLQTGPGGRGEGAGGSTTGMSGSTMAHVGAAPRRAAPGAPHPPRAAPRLPGEMAGHHPGGARPTSGPAIVALRLPGRPAPTAVDPMAVAPTAVDPMAERVDRNQSYPGPGHQSLPGEWQRLSGVA